MNAKIFIITGENMGDLSNQFLEIPVPLGCDHTFMLEQFVLEHKIEYPYWDYCFSHDIVKLSILDNVVIFVGGYFHVVALPDIISDYQQSELFKIQSFFYNDQSLFSIMNIKKENDRIVYEGLDSSSSKKFYLNIVEEKYQKWKKQSPVLNRKFE